jgi:5-methylcytosine-specific restriction endonuclease McrA
MSTPERNKQIGDTLREKYQTDPEFRERVAAAQNVKGGSDHWNWKGGVTPLNQRTRTSKESNAWKLAVLHRDKYKCRLCGSDEELHAHHINSWATFPEDRYVLENGLTMCNKCHSTYHKYEKEVKKNGEFAEVTEK